MTRTETYEERAKELFIDQPANMKLLIVVDKLLTGFDAPPCTYLYIDKSMQDHGLFQAICRTNRLDGDDKEFGHIVDYKGLFPKVENAIAVYTSELDHSAPGPDPEVLLKDRLEVARERLENALETLALICEPVEPPRGELEHIQYFCGNTEIEADLEARAPFRAELYKATASLVRAFANISADLNAAGYSEPEVARIRAKTDHYVKLREVIRLASGEVLDLKAYEADMRHLIDTYIEASEPRTISPFGELSLIELIVKSGIAEAINAQLGGLRGNRDAIAETIENNVRRKIIKEHLADPAFYESMSELLDEVIKLRKANAISYEDYLKRVADVAIRVQAGYSDETPVQLRNSPALRALYSNLTMKSAVDEETASDDARVELALRIDEAVRHVRSDDWRGHLARERSVKRALYDILLDDAEVERIFLIVKAQSEY